MTEVIGIQVDQRQLAEVRQLLLAIPRAMPKVMSRGVNKTASGARTKVVREMARHSGVQQKFVRKAIRMKRASQRHWVATIRVRGWRFPLTAKGARQTKKGVTYRGKSGRELLPGGFIAAMPGGHTGVFTRRSTSRLPIDEHFTPSMVDVFDEAAELSRHRLDSEIAAKLQSNIYTQVQLILAKRRAV